MVAGYISIRHNCAAPPAFDHDHVKGLLKGQSIGVFNIDIVNRAIWRTALLQVESLLCSYNNLQADYYSDAKKHCPRTIVNEPEIAHSVTHTMGVVKGICSV